MSSLGYYPEKKAGGDGALAIIGVVVLVIIFFGGLIAVLASQDYDRMKARENARAEVHATEDECKIADFEIGAARSVERQRNALLHKQNLLLSGKCLETNE